MFTPELDPNWVHSPITPEIVGWCKSFGQFLSPEGVDREGKKPLTTSQLRRFFGEVKRIKMQSTLSASDIAMLVPQLAYAVGRDKNNYGQNKTRIKEFYEEMSRAVEGIRPENLKSDYDNFVQIFEAVVAYHKYYGGRENG